MSAVIVGATNAFASAANVVVPFPVGAVVGDTAILFSSSLGGVDPLGWTSLYAAYYGAGNPVYGRGLTKQLDAADILAGSVTVEIAGAGMISCVVLEGAITIRTPFTAAAETTGNPHTVSSNANVETGDTLLFYYGERDWDDITWLSGTILTDDGQPIGFSNSLMTFDAPSGGVQSAQNTTLWGGNKYGAVLAVNSAAPVNSMPIVAQFAIVAVTAEFVIPTVYVPLSCGNYLSTMPYWIGEN